MATGVWIEGPKRGPWKVRWREVRDGKTVKRSAGPFETVGERDEAVAAKEAELARARKRERRRGVVRTLVDVADLYVQHHRALGKITEAYASEIKDVVQRLARQPEWCAKDDDEAWREVPLTAITADAVELWRSRYSGARGKGRAGKGTDKPLQILRRLIRWAGGPPLRAAVDDEVLRLEPRPRRPKPKPALLTDVQVAAVLARAAEFGDAVATAIEHLARYGCRPKELCRLTVGDWDTRARRLTHRVTKNHQPASHVVDEAFAKRLDQLTKGRPKTAPLYLSTARDAKGKPIGWEANRRGKYQAIVDFYWANISSKLNAPDAPKEDAPDEEHAAWAARQWEPWRLLDDDRLAANQLGIYCLKDYAISRMEAMGIDDATKAEFTGHLDLKVFARYKTTNATRAATAAERLGRDLPTLRSAGGQIGGHGTKTGAG